jgi:hypothetical protein
MPELRSIETFYNGYRFRSRLEARWAVFFDEMGWQYEYEPQGLVLSDGRPYLPDFLLTAARAWIEIKPQAPSQEERMTAHDFNRAGEWYNLFVGLPYAFSCFFVMDNDQEEYWSPAWFCSVSHEAAVTNGTYKFVFDPVLSVGDARRFQWAYDVAKSVRFEDGEYGQPALLPAQVLTEQQGFEEEIRRWSESLSREFVKQYRQAKAGSVERERLEAEYHRLYEQIRNAEDESQKHKLLAEYNEVVKQEDLRRVLARNERARG